MNDSFLSDFSDNLTPADAAWASLVGDPVQPAATIRYSSRGRLLVLGKPDALDAVLNRLPPNLEVTVAIAVPCPPDLSGKLSGKAMRCFDSLSGMDVVGWLGDFRLTASRYAETEGDTPGIAFCESGFDLVLDLLDPPIARRQNPPIGYFAAGLSNPETLEEALTQLPRWVGEFDKPNYLHFEPGICDYRTGGSETCRLCFDVCGTWAITKDEAQITISPYLCQGCGDCATVCPTGSITYNFPSPQRMLIRIERMLQVYFQHGGKVPVLLLHDATKGRAWLDDHRDFLPINVLPFEIEALGAAGAEIWLMAMAFGAVQVLLLDTGAMNEKTRTLLDAQIEWGRAVLAGLGFGQEALRMVGADEMREAPIPFHPFRPIEPLEDWAESVGKRSLIRDAVEHLRQQASSPPFAVLAAGAPFGAVRVDPEACTLCMQCIPACPENALIGDRDGKRLAFVEASCIQCGGCVRVCPEEAVTLQPRFTYDKAAITAPRPLVQK